MLCNIRGQVDLKDNKIDPKKYPRTKKMLLDFILKMDSN